MKKYLLIVLLFCSCNWFEQCEYVGVITFENGTTQWQRVKENYTLKNGVLYDGVYLKHFQVKSFVVMRSENCD